MLDQKPDVEEENPRDVADQIDFDATTEAVRQAVRELPDNFREVVVLKYFDEMKYEDMSEVLGTSVGALKASYHLAVQKIASFFEDDI